MKPKRFDMPRMWRSPYSAFAGDDGARDDLGDETVTALAAYDDETLAAIAGQGFNAIWVHGRLRHLVPSSVFREFGPHWRTHVRNMRRLMQRAARHGLRVYVYMQPPRGIPHDDAFWSRHPDVRGVEVASVSHDGSRLTMRALCTSTQPVKTCLRDSSERLLRELPELGGVILITASEFTSHCYGRYSCRATEFAKRGTTDLPCPRCRERSPTEVVSEIVGLVHEGVRAASDTAHVIAWNWSWTQYEATPSPSIIRRLPRDVVLMAGFERGARKKILGKMRHIDEYALSYAGPSPRCRRSIEMARKRGLRVIAKLQIGTTHELATVPNLPLIGNLYDKVRGLRGMGLRGFMGCWNFGNMVTANTAAFNRFLTARQLPPRKRALIAFAEAYFPGCMPEDVVTAWETFAEAMNHYPFSIRFLYFGPVNYALAYPMQPRQAKHTSPGRSWQIDPRGEWLDQTWAGGFTFGDIITALGRVARTWRRGAVSLERGLRGCTVPAARAERDNAWVCYHIFRSAWNAYRVFRLRKAWRPTHMPAYLRIARDELANVEAALPLVKNDPRFGWHSECQAYMFDAAGMRRKIRSLRRQLTAAAEKDEG